MKNLSWPLIVTFALIATPGYAQDKSADTNMHILRDKVADREQDSCGDPLRNGGGHSACQLNADARSCP
jgi:hypothetical protein